MLLLLESIAATIRLTRFITADTITQRFWKRFFKRFPAQPSMRGEGPKPAGKGWIPVTAQDDPEDVLGWHQEPTKIGAWVRDLLACPYWCVSLWAGLFIALIGRTRPGRVVVRGFALSLAKSQLYGKLK